MAKYVQPAEASHNVSSSYFHHCDSVYGTCLNNNDIRRIQKLHSCIPLLYEIRRGQKYHKLTDSSWLNMYNRRRLHITCPFLILTAVIVCMDPV